MSVNLLDYCMSYVEDLYLKVIRVDFSDGSFEVYKLKNGMNIPAVKTIQDWMDKEISDEVIYPEDVAKLNQFFNVENLRRLISETDKGLYCSYRRKGPQGKYIHTSICVIRDKENYSQDHEYGLLFVKDINSIYETEYGCILEDFLTTDSFTKLLDKHAYQRDIMAYKGGSVGVVFADINGLKYVNDKKGHISGDKLILEFAGLLKRAFNDWKIYHTGGDEFIIIAYDVNLRSFLQRVVGWHRFIWEYGEYPIAAIGYSLDVNVHDMAELITEAENAMYVDKDIFYRRYPQYKR